MKFEVCLFDLDQTLIDTDDIAQIREAGKNNSTKSYIKEVVDAYEARDDRLFYSEELILKIRKEFPDMKIGVFTRSPRSYATTILNLAYPEIDWDVIVAYEDVKHTKPHGEGIDKAMWSFDYEAIRKVVLVGDGNSDIRAAYNAGCVVVLDKSSWGNYTPENWKALSNIPDVIIKSPHELLDVLNDYEAHLPELERVLTKPKANVETPRFLKANKFIPKECGGDSTPFVIHACGRSFAGYKSLEWRKVWHDLTLSIIENKTADEFPDEWIQTILLFIRKEFAFSILMGKTVTITCVPHRPGRTPRLEALLKQLAEAYAKKPIKGKGLIKFLPGILAYKDGVRSNSKDKLSAIDRFKNIRDHLFVERTDLVEKGSKIVVIDDVSTSGSSLIYAKKYLNEAGAGEVTCLSVALNISNVLYE